MTLGFGLVDFRQRLGCFGFFQCPFGILLSLQRGIGIAVRLLPCEPSKNRGHDCDHRHQAQSTNHPAQSRGGAGLIRGTLPFRFGQTLGLCQFPLSRRFASLLVGDARLLAGSEKCHRRRKTRAVAFGPGGVGTLGLLPSQSDPQLRVAIQAGFAQFVQRRAFSQAVVDAGGLRFFLDPLTQTRPDSHQTFVRNVDDRMVGQLHIRRGHQERDAAVPVGVDDRHQFFCGNLQNLTQPPQPLRTTDPPVVRFLNCQCLKQSLAQFALSIAAQ